MGLMDMFSQDVDLKKVAESGYGGSLVLSKKLYFHQVEDTDIKLSSRQKSELEAIMAESDRILRVETSGRSGTFFKVTRSGKPYSDGNRPCEGIEETYKGDERIRLGTAKWARDGQIVPAAVFGAEDVDAALENLEAQDAKTGVDKLKSSMWRNLLSGANEIVVHGPTWRDDHVRNVTVRSAGGQDVLIGKLSQEEIEGLKQVTSGLDLRLHIKSSPEGIFANEIYRNGKLDPDLLPDNAGALPPEIAAICQNAVRIDLWSHEHRRMGEYAPLDDVRLAVTAYDADGKKTGQFLTPGYKWTYRAILEGIQKTDLLLSNAWGERNRATDSDYSQGGKALDQSEFNDRVAALKEGGPNRKAGMVPRL
jgi:hypothetical protein